MRQNGTAEPARSLLAVLGIHLERERDRVGRLVDVEGVHGQRVAADPLEGAGVGGQHEGAVAPVHQRALHRDEVHAVEGRVDEERVVLGVGAHGV